MAVTQNFVSPSNLEAAIQWQALGAGAVRSGAAAPVHAAVPSGRAGQFCPSSSAADVSCIRPPGRWAPLVTGAPPGASLQAPCLTLCSCQHS